MTGNDLMQEAMLLVQRIRNFNQTASPDDLSTCTLALNNLLSSWNAQGLAIYSVAPLTQNLASGIGDYTIGPGATINANRPVRVGAWNVRTSSGQANGGEPVDAATFAEQAVDRSATGARVKMLNYDAAFPVASVHLYPKPLGGTLELWVWDALAAITDFTLTLNYPPGYLQGIVYNLALVIAPKFERPLDPAIKLAADEAKANLASSNAAQHRSPVPSAAAE